MKSHSDSLLLLAADILTDVRLAYPRMRGLDLDHERLSRLVSNRGLAVFTLDLPERDNALLRGLRTGRLDATGTARYSKQYPVPRLFAGLYMRIFDQDLCLREDADVNCVFFLRQLLCVGKKTLTPCSPKRKFKTIQEYFNVEKHLIGPTLEWTSDSLDHAGVGSRLHLRDRLGTDLPLFPDECRGEARIKLLLDRCQRVADFVAEELGIFCPECFVEKRRSEARSLGPKHGPGAVAERSGRAFDKNSFTNWSAKLERKYPFSEWGKMPNDGRVKPRNHEAPARLIAVPKTAKGPRLIAAEPSEHMFLQKVLDSFLVERIEESVIGNFIDFKKQALSGKLVLKASLDQSLATIDLSSASDRLSLFVVERIFRRNPSILNALHATRTRWLRDPFSGDHVILKKFASQGTAVTFPIQSIVFLVIALAATLKGSPTRENVARLRDKVRVYGDDIIIPTDGYVDIVDLLTTLDLKVNSEKSFSEGHFRESCGVDAFKGYDVTPVKPKTTISGNPTSDQALIDTINNLYKKGLFNASIGLENRQRARSLKGFGLVGSDAGATGYACFSFESFVRRAVETSISSGRWARRAIDTLTHSAGVRGPNERNVRHGLRISSFGEWGIDARSLRIVLGPVRFNRSLQRLECRRLAIASRTNEVAYDCGYSGLLWGQLCPSSPEDFRRSERLGVPDRSVHRKVSRWEPLENLFSTR